MTAAEASPHLRSVHGTGGGRFGRNHFGSRLQLDGGFLAPFEDPNDTDAHTPEPSVSPEPTQSFVGTNMLDDDDEDDDGKLDFVAFSGKKTGK